MDLWNHYLSKFDPVASRLYIRNIHITMLNRFLAIKYSDNERRWNHPELFRVRAPKISVLQRDMQFWFEYPAALTSNWSSNANSIWIGSFGLAFPRLPAIRSSRPGIGNTEYSHRAFWLPCSVLNSLVAFPWRWLMRIYVRISRPRARLAQVTLTEHVCTNDMVSIIRRATNITSFAAAPLRKPRYY